MPNRLKTTVVAAAIAAALALTACDSDGLSTAEVTAAAEERVAKALGLSRDAALFTNVFVGRPVDGEVVLCGTVEGTRADGTAIEPRRFIAGAEREAWVRFDAASDMSQVPINNAVDWVSTCAGEEEVR